MRPYLLAVLVLLAGSTAFGQNQNWIGHRVLTKSTVPLKVLDKVVDDGTESHIYKVTHVNGKWLWLTSGSVAGWVQASDVVWYDTAIDFFTREIQRNPANARARLQRGRVWDDKEDLGKALADYSEAIRLDPKNPWALLCRASVWNEETEYDRIIEDLSEAIRLDPGQWRAFFARGYARAQYD
ncbi:MAG TPA: tetratricopeptide repeat protein, partial [Planctomycetaceae bacterium]|nr:tetratricopeptide repeat protein [Planctomycetaceae bacterium]